MATKTAAREVDPNPGDIDTSPGRTNNGPILNAAVRTVLDDIKDAVQTYPTTYVKLEIVDIEKDGDLVNTGEEVRFHVKVTNDGPMTMTDVRLKAVAKSGTEVKSGGAIEVFRTEALSANGIETLGGHGGSDETSALFILEAPNVAKPDGTVLVEVTVEEYNLLWDHILIGHSDPTTTPKVTFASSVEVDD